jgi:methionine synthase II (cobalamin-independent)
MSLLSEHSLIEEIVDTYPELIRPLREKGIVCIRCGEPVWGTLKQVAEEKSIENLDEIIREMNRLIE